MTAPDGGLRARLVQWLKMSDESFVQTADLLSGAAVLINEALAELSAREDALVPAVPPATETPDFDGLAQRWEVSESLNSWDCAQELRALLRVVALRNPEAAVPRPAPAPLILKMHCRQCGFDYDVAMPELPLPAAPREGP